MQPGTSTGPAGYSLHWWPDVYLTALSPKRGAALLF